VPAKVKREVRPRDGGKCRWPLASGGACGPEVRVEIDHVVPRGRGGAPRPWRRADGSFHAESTHRRGAGRSPRRPSSGREQPSLVPGEMGHSR
jgi:hypothetical protein